MRTFIAMEMKDKDAIKRVRELQESLIASGINAKPVKLDQLHFTLIFLGEVKESMLEEIKGCLKDIRFNPVNVTYKRLGAFPNLRKARVIWIGVDEESSKLLSSLAREVENRLIPLGFKSDKPFTPHITILRVKDARVKDARFDREEVFGYDLLNEIKVKKSELTPSGPIYTDLFSIVAT